MKIFDTKVQETKYNVLREVAVQTWKGNDVFAELNEIARKSFPATCCLFLTGNAHQFNPFYD